MTKVINRPIRANIRLTFVLDVKGVLLTLGFEDSFGGVGVGV